MRWPGTIPAGRISTLPCSFWDWLPTFTDIAGLPAPARTDGVSLVPTLKGVEGQLPPRVYFEYFEANKTPGYPVFEPSHRGRVRKQMQAIRLGDFMGVRYDVANHSDPFEIYNVVTDPKEALNLAAKPEFAALQQEMKDTVLSVLTVQIRRPNAPMTTSVFPP